MSEGLVSLMQPVGPVAEAFVADERFLTCIMGPYGSAKTTSCIRKIWSLLLLQKPGPDGVRRARWAVVRDTYAQLTTNVLNSWFTWFPKTKANWNGDEMCHRLDFTLAFADGSEPMPVHLEVYFRAMGDQKAEQVLKGLELTGLWLNEVDTLDNSVVRFGLPRLGRYPPAKLGGCTWHGMIADMNAPDVDNWTYELFVEQKLPFEQDALELLREQIGPRFGVGFHRQPGAREPGVQPENIANLPAGYYEQMQLGMTPNDIRRFIDNEFGAVRNGQPVYPEYNDDFHCAKEPLKPLANLPVAMAFDGGSTPAAVFGQRTVTGQIRTLSEVVAFDPSAKHLDLEQMGPTAFGRLCGEHWLEHYARSEFGGAAGDPAAWYGGDDEDLSWARTFWKAFRKTVGSAARDWKCKPAPVAANRLTPRLEAVRRGLVESPGGQPGQLISPACRMLRRGFNNGYVIERQQLSNGTGAFKSVPTKNAFSHVHDAKQYLDLLLTKRGQQDEAMGIGEREHRRRRGRGRIDFGSGIAAHREVA